MVSGDLLIVPNIFTLQRIATMVTWSFPGVKAAGPWRWPHTPF